MLRQATPWGGVRALGWCFPREEGWVWGPEGLQEPGMAPRGPARVEGDVYAEPPPGRPCTSRDCASLFVISKLVGRVHHKPSTCAVMLLLGHPEAPPGPALSPRPGGRNVRLAFLPGTPLREPATLPSKECCLLILSDSGHLPLRAAFQILAKRMCHVTAPPRLPEIPSIWYINKYVTPPLFLPYTFFPQVINYSAVRLD